MKNNKKFFCTLMVLILALTTYSPTFSFAFPKENNVSEKVITQANDVSIGATETEKKYGLRVYKNGQILYPEYLLWSKELFLILLQS